jgi:hypothetical protein
LEQNEKKEEIRWSQTDSPAGINSEKTCTANHTKRKRKGTQSIAKSSLLSIEEQLGLNGLFEGEMTHFSFDIPLSLRKAFVGELKDNGDSGCKFLVKQAFSYVLASRLKKQSFGNTLRRAIDTNLTVENLNFVQNVQSRPRRLIHTTNFEVNESDEPVCTMANCKTRGGKPGVSVAKGAWIPTGKEYELCFLHYSEVKQNPDKWKITSSPDNVGRS